MPRSSRAPTGAAPSTVFARCLNSIISFRELLPLMYCMILLGDRFGGHDSSTCTWSRGYRSFQNLDVVRPADLPHQIPNPHPHRARQNRLAILRDPHKMVLDVKTTMRTRAVFFHPAIVPQIENLKVSPKGEGFRPIVGTINSRSEGSSNYFTNREIASSKLRRPYFMVLVHPQ